MAPSAHPPPPSDGGKIWPLMKDILALAVIPLIGWVINLQVNNALRDERIVQMQHSIDELREQTKEIEGVKKDVQDAAVHMARLEGKLDMANGRLDEIRAIIGR